MCNSATIEFGRRLLNRENLQGKRVLEVGSLDVNGSLRGLVEPYGPASYVGVDLAEGKGVDMVSSAENLYDTFGPSSFDVLISTELIEHVRDWRKVRSNFKQVLAPEGLILITTRSIRFPRQDYPFNFWRHEVIGYVHLVFGLPRRQDREGFSRPRRLYQCKKTFGLC